MNARRILVVEDDAAIGSDTMLVAPRRVGEGAITAAGAVVTHDVPAGEVWVGAPAHNSVWGAVVWSLVILAIFAPLAVRRYRRAAGR